MAKEKKTLKFQMMMSPEEAEVLDDWMFRHRVRSRAEAIRRLCQIGMIHERSNDELSKNVTRHNQYADLKGKELSELLEKHPVDPIINEAISRMRVAYDAAIANVYYDVLSNVIETFALNAPIQIDDALEITKKFREKLAKMKAGNRADHDELIRMIQTLTGKLPKSPEAP